MDLDKVDLFPLKYCMLDLVAEDVSRFCEIRVLDSALLEHFTLTRKRFIWTKSRRRCKTMRNAVRALHTSRDCEKRSCKTIIKIKKRI